MQNILGLMTVLRPSAGLAVTYLALVFRGMNL